MKYTIRELSLMGIVDVSSHIKNFNEKLTSEANIEGKNSFYSVREEISGNYKNAYQFERELACDKWINIHKKIYGFKPKLDTSSWTLQDFEDDIIAISSEINFSNDSKLIKPVFSDFYPGSQKMMLITSF